MVSMEERQTLSVLVQNQSGVLSRIAGLFSSRGFNIASLTVGETVNPDISRMTIVVEGDHHTLEQVVKQLRKLIVTIKVEDFGERPYVSAELLAVKVSAPPGRRSEIMDIIEVFNGKVVDMTQDTLTIRFTGETKLIDDVVELLRPYGIKETARTGALALGREQR